MKKIDEDYIMASMSQEIEYINKLHSQLEILQKKRNDSFMEGLGLGMILGSFVMLLTWGLSLI